jgi:hypothetical protein
MQARTGTSDPESKLHAAMMWRPFSHGPNQRPRAQLHHASDKEEEFELYCFFELQQIKQVQAHTARCPWSVSLEVSVMTVTMEKMSYAQAVLELAACSSFKSRRGLPRQDWDPDVLITNFAWVVVWAIHAYLAEFLVRRSLPNANITWSVPGSTFPFPSQNGFDVALSFYYWIWGWRASVNFQTSGALLVLSFPHWGASLGGQRRLEF